MTLQKPYGKPGQFCHVESENLDKKLNDLSRFNNSFEQTGTGMLLKQDKN
jgi:hypothetical protein